MQTHKCMRLFPTVCPHKVSSPTCITCAFWIYAYVYLLEFHSLANAILVGESAVGESAHQDVKLWVSSATNRTHTIYIYPEYTHICV